MSKNYQFVTFLSILKLIAFQMNYLNVFIHFSEEIVSKLYQSIYWTDTIFKLKTRIKSIQKILAVFQYPHLIEATTWIDFVPL